MSINVLYHDLPISILETFQSSTFVFQKIYRYRVFFILHGDFSNKFYFKYNHNCEYIGHLEKLFVHFIATTSQSLNLKNF